MFAAQSLFYRAVKLPALLIGHFLCLHDKAAQPRGIVVMAIPSPVEDFATGSGLPFFMPACKKTLHQ